MALSVVLGFTRLSCQPSGIRTSMSSAASLRSDVRRKQLKSGDAAMLSDACAGRGSGFPSQKRSISLAMVPQRGHPGCLFPGTGSGLHAGAAKKLCFVAEIRVSEDVAA